MDIVHSLEGVKLPIEVKKHKVFSLSSAEVEYRVVHGVNEALWIQSILEELKLYSQDSIKFFYDNKSDVAIAHNLVLHDTTKHMCIILSKKR